MARNHVKMGRIIICRGNVTRGKEQCGHVWQWLMCFFSQGNLTRCKWLTLWQGPKGQCGHVWQEDM